MLFPALSTNPDAVAVRCAGTDVSYRSLATSASTLAADLPGPRVAVWATPQTETVVGVLAGLLAGVAVVPVNPKSGDAELAHIIDDSAPSAVLCRPDAELPPALRAVRRIDVAPPATSGTGTVDLPEQPPDTAGLVVYTSGTTGPPKGVILPHRALAATLDALADAWAWTADDVVVHALPLFHVHGLVLGMLGPLRRGGTAHHLGRFDPDALATAITGWSRPVLVFGVPTMYHRLAERLPDEPELAERIGAARVLVSGSAALPLRDHERITTATGQRVIERYGMTETLMNTSVRIDAPGQAGTVGTPLRDVQLRLVDDSGTPIRGADGATIGEIQVRGPNLFTGYLNRPDATAAAFDGDWFATGDMAVAEPHGAIRIVGRKATDLIKSAGYKIGAGEIENALLEHPQVAEAAVTGEADPDLGERIVAWVVTTDGSPTAEQLSDHVSQLLSPHKRPRDVRFVSALPRNELGKVTKKALRG